MTRIITDEEFIQAVDAAVEERGRDFVYPEEWKQRLDSVGGATSSLTCLYNLPDDSPACLFGLAFHKLGLAPASGVVTDILDMTSSPWSYGDVDDAFQGESAATWRERADVEFRLSTDVRYAAQNAQAAQDKGDAWGDASEIFHRYLDGEAPGAD